MTVPKQKTIVLIDGSNTYFAQKKIGKWLDWVKVKRYLEKNYTVSEIRYYAGVRKKDTKTRSFLKKLHKIGFKVITKPVKIVTDAEGKRFEKANFDVEITADALLLQKQFNILILFSGDSDFAYLSTVLKELGKITVVLATRQTLAWELKLKARYYFLEDIKGLTKHKSFVKI